MSERVLVLYYANERDAREVSSAGLCSYPMCRRRPVVIAGAPRRKFYCAKHLRWWLKKHDYAGVDTI